MHRKTDENLSSSTTRITVGHRWWSVQVNEDKYYDKYYEVSTEDLVLTIDIRNIRTCYNISGGLILI